MPNDLPSPAFDADYKGDISHNDTEYKVDSPNAKVHATTVRNVSSYPLDPTHTLGRARPSHQRELHSQMEQRVYPPVL
jgi:hypothetical protein